MVNPINTGRLPRKSDGSIDFTSIVDKPKVEPKPTFNFNEFERNGLLPSTAHSLMNDLQPAKDTAKRINLATELKLNPNLVLPGNTELDVALNRARRNQQLDENQTVAKAFTRNPVNASIIQNDIDKFIALSNSPGIKRREGVLLNVEGELTPFLREPTQEDFPVAKYGYKKAYEVYTKTKREYANAIQLRTNQNRRDREAEYPDGYGQMTEVPRTAFEGFWQPFATGFSGAEQAWSTLTQEFGYGGIYEQQKAAIDRFNAGRSADEQIDFNASIRRGVRYAQLARRGEKYAVPADIREGMQKIGQAEGLVDWAIASFENPGSFFEMLQESFAASSPVLATSVLGIVSPVAAPVVLAGLTSGLLEYSFTLDSLATEFGYDTQDALSMADLFENEGNMTAFREEAVERGVTIGLFDLMTAGLSRYFVRARAPGDLQAIKGGRIAPAVSTATLTTGGEMVGGGSGEAAAQLVVGRKPINWGEVAFEAIGEGPTGTIGALTATLMADNTRRKYTALENAKASMAENNAQSLNEAAEILSETEALGVEGPAGRAAVESVLNELTDPNDTVSLSPESYNQAINTAQENGETIEVSEGVQEQIATANETGVDIVMSRSEFLAKFSNTSAWETVVENVRTSPEAMTLAEAREHTAGGNPVIADAAARQANDGAKRTRNESMQTIIYKRLLASMGTLERTSTSQQKIHALLIAKSYMRGAEVEGISPLEYYNNNRPQFADAIPTGHTFDQQSNSDTAWFGNSRAANEQGAVIPMVSISEENTATRFEPADDSAPEGDTTQPTYVLSVQNPFTAPINAINDPDLMAQHLINQGVLVADDVIRLREQAENNEQFSELLRQEVENAGYDSFGYAAQDGSQAYVPFKDEQVKPLQNVEELNQTAFHGTTQKFDQFDLGMAGANLGQAYGYGIYFTNEQEVAEYYAGLDGYVIKAEVPENSELLRSDRLLDDQGDAQPLVDKMFDNLPPEILNDDQVSKKIYGWELQVFLWEHYKYGRLITDGELGETAANESVSKFFNKYGLKGLRSNQQKLGTEIADVFVIWDSNVISNIDVANQRIASQETYFQYAGVKAKSAPMETFGKAQEMLEEKRSRQKILEETGWTIGPDKQWRWEISDNDVSYGSKFENLIARYKERVKIDDAEYDKRQAARQKVIDSLGPDDLEPPGLAKVETPQPKLAQVDLRQRFNPQSYDDLSEFIDHPELFAAYPHLQYMSVVVNTDMGRDTLGSYIRDDWHPQGGYIVLNALLPLISAEKNQFGSKIQTVKSVLLHEIQHAIQDFENFARGGNPQQAFMKLLIPDLLTNIDEKKIELSILKENAIPLKERADKWWARVIQGQLFEDVQKLREYSLRDNPGRIWRLIRPYNNLFSHGEFYKLYRVDPEDRERGRDLQSRGDEIGNLRQPKKDQAIREWAADMANFIDPFITQDTRDFYETHSDITPNKLIKEFLRNIYALERQQDKPAQRKLGKQIKALEDSISLDGFVETNIDKLLQELSGNARKRNMIYYRLFGEIEARNTQKRMLLTDEQRRVRLPEETQDFIATPIIAFGENLITEAPEFYPQSSPAEVNRGAFDPRTLTITLLRNADASTMIHEVGHLFFENNMNLIKRLLALETLNETQSKFLNDMNVLFTHLGISGPINEQILQFDSLPFEEKRFYHEKFAESWERYAFEGKSPSIELQRVFQRFKEFMKSVYQTLKAYLEQNPEAGDLSDEVRGIFDRMLATDEEIKLVTEARSMLPLFESAEEAGMSEEGYAAYLEMNEEARAEAVQNLDEKSLRDLKYLSNARAKKIRTLQRQAREKRRHIRSSARLDILAEPVYQAWQFLTNKVRPEDKIDQLDPPPVSKDGAVDYEIDTLMVAIAKLGGLNKKAIVSEWGYDPEDKSEVFKRKPVVRVRGGLTPDAMVELLAEYGYLERDENGKADITDLEEKFMFSHTSGEAVYSSGVNYNFLNYDAQPGDQVVNPSALESGRLDYDYLADMVGTEKADKLKAMGMTARNGLSVQMLADRFGFASAEVFVNDILKADNITDAVNALVDQRMIEQYAELSDQQSIEAAADRALANVARTRFVNTELNILGTALGKVKVAYQAAKMQAAATLSRQKIRNIKPRNAFNAAARAARAARKALKNGDNEQAYVEKMNQLLSTQLSEQGYKARDMIDKALKYFAGFNKPGAAKRLAPEYLDAILDVLSRFDLSTQSVISADRKSAFAQYIIGQLDQDVIPDVALNLFLTEEQRALYAAALLKNPDMDDAQKATMLSGFAQEGVRKSHYDLTFDEFNELYETVKQIEHIGKFKNQLYGAQATRRVDEQKSILTDVINKFGSGRKPSNKTPVNFRGRAKRLAKRFSMSHVRVSTLAFMMDGGIDGGPMFQFLIKTATDKSAYETEQRALSTERLLKIMAPMFKNAKRFGGMQKVRYWESVQQSLTYEEIVVMALNFGNESNISRLTLNNNLSEAQLRSLFAEALSEADWQAVQNVWTYLDSWRPKVGAQMKRIEGKEPDWIVPMPFEIQTLDGKTIQLDGGYYPVIYDPEASVQASDQDAKEQAKQQMATGRSVQTTRRSFTKSRYEGEIQGRPLLLNLNGLFTGVSDVIHDLAWREWLIDFNKVMAKGSVADAIFKNYGREAHEQIMRWREDIARGYVSTNGIDWMFGMLRRGVSAAGLGMNIMNSILQTTGVLGTMTRVSPKYLLPELIRFVANPIRATRDVKELSSFMRTRSKTRFRELREVMNVVEGKTKVTRTLQAATYFLMLQVQQTVDVMSWNAAYRQHMAKSGDHELSRGVADQIIKDTQGSGEIMDLSQIERGGASQKLFTVFYNYANTQLNMLIATKNMSEASKMKKLWNYTLVLMLPVIAEQILKNSFTPGELEEYDPDNPEAFARKLAGEYAAYWLNMFVFFRELGYPVKAAITGNWFGGYGGPSGTRVIGDAAKFINQASQGEIDEAFVRSGISLTSSLTGLPGAQINRTIKGTTAYIEGDTDNPAAVLFGYQGE